MSGRVQNTQSLENRDLIRGPLLVLWKGHRMSGELLRSREHVVALIRHHGLPLGILERAEAEREGYVHRYEGDTWRDGEPGDKTVVEGGEISVTAVSLRGLSLDPADPLPL